ncbi:N-acetylmuramoyl-L-alanine amidase [Stigmatella sp. ncwal1]|uniref:N-acetylmuramoyl-L-alanine amidase n=1 Tax=Stigmatella ashevillensis TaxID=2995309 RepID=A0ABT5D471_9BACT|nr:N-acetylmuramoyl-L-alanine amidase [Stigmatella ashevillena]MDC0707885.1 N-acetylmuramoyl-L-alanine amidase [Stigmatella ashevillena]
MSTLRNALAAATAALSLAACGPEQSPETSEPVQMPSGAFADAAGDAVRRGAVGALDPLFEQAAREFNVPADLLKAISYTETRWQMVRGEQEFDGMPAAHGVMALRGAALERGAALAGVSAEAVRDDALANIRAGAALLSAHADELKVERADVGAWAPAVARLSGITDTGAQAEYIHQEVYSTLRNGVFAESADGQVTASIMPSPVEVKFALPMARALAAGPDYAAAIWRPSPNYNARPAGTKVSMIVIHTCEGAYSGCWGWLVNSASGVSAHYVVNESGSEVSQLVRESDRGWHVGATYDCSLNGGVECGVSGTSSNNFTVGIEHGGFASQSSFPAGQIEASAKLSCDISKGQGITRDSYHIVAHGRLQPYNRTDPGPNWPWSSYLSKVNSYCGGTTPSPSGLIIDSNNSNNDSAKGYIEVSANWVSSTNVGGYYGTGYFVAPTEAISDPATFWFYLPAAATKTIDAWWTSATDRSTSAPFIVSNAAGTQLATVKVNQQANGGKWNTLGSWSFSAGWNKVQVSRWTGTGYQVVADAIQVR